MKKIKIVQLENDQLDRQEQDRATGGQAYPAEYGWCGCHLSMDEFSDTAFIGASTPKPPIGGGGGGPKFCPCNFDPTGYMPDDAFIASTRS